MNQVLLVAKNLSRRKLRTTLMLVAILATAFVAYTKQRMIAQFGA